MMRDFKSSGKKPIKEIQTPRPPKHKLESIGRESTRQKKTLKQVSTNELFEKTFLSLDSAAFILDNNMPPTIVDCNPAATKIFGYDREEFLGKTTQFLHINKKALKEFQNILYPAIEKQGFLSFSEYRMKRKNGVVFPTEHSVLPLKDERNNRIGWISIVRDISARREVEKQLKQSREFLANTINALDDTFFVKDEEHRWAALNDAACKAIGRPREGLIGRNDYDLFPKEQADVFWEKDNLVFETGETNVNEEEVTWHGKSHTISTKKSLFKDFITGKRFIVGTARDVTERKQMEKTLQESEQKYRALVEQSLQGIIILQDSRIVFANAAAAEIGGHTIEEVLALSLEDMMAFVPHENRASILERLKNRFAGKTAPENYELCLEHKSGDTFWLNLFFSPIEYQGKFAIQIIFVDITDQKKMEEALRESEQKYRALVEQSMHGIVIFQDYRIVLANQSAADITRLTMDELQNLSLEDMIAFVPPEDRETIRERLKDRFAGKNEPANYELRLIRKNGREFWLNLFFSPIEYQGNHAIQLAFVDITDNKRLEETLRVSEASYRELADSITDIFFAMDKNLRYTYWNKASEKLTGIPAKHAVGKSIFDVFPDTEATREAAGVYQDVLKTQQPQTFMNEYRLKDKDFSFEINAYPSKQGLSVFAKDITERLQAEKQLKQSKEFLDNSINAIDDPFFAKDEGHRWTVLNDAACEVMGRPREELIGKSDYDLFAKEQADVFWERDNLVLKNGVTDVNEEEITWHGKSHIISTKKSVFTDSITGKKFIVGTIRDITERKQAEEKLKIREQTLRAFLNAPSESAILIDTEGTILDINRVAVQRLGKSAEELIGMSIYNYLPADIAEYRKAQGAEVIRSGKPVRFQDQRGGRHYDNNVYPVFDDEGRVSAIAVFAGDITKREQAEEKLREYQEQLKSLASELTLAEERERHRIATELHDEISQLLFISKMKVEALEKPVSDKKVNDTLDEISDSLGRIIAAMRSLTFDLSSPILYEFGFEEAVAEWLSEQVEKKHGITTEFEDDGLHKPLDDDIRVLLFRNVRELLINVIKHARAKKIKVSIRKIGSRIRVSVEDDGVGFEPAKAESMITNKEAFGLFSIQERLEHLGGNLEIKSSPGCGCRVTITSPLSRENISKDK